MSGAGLVTIGDLAARDQVTKQSVSKLVKRLVDRHNLPVKRDARGRVEAVDVETFDLLRGRFGDAIRDQRPGGLTALPLERAQPAPIEFEAPTNATLDGARREKLVEDTKLTRLRLAAEANALVRVDMVEQATSRLGEEIVRQVDLLPYLDRLAAASGCSEIHALRAELKRVNGEIHARIADALAAIALAAPARDDLLATEDQAAI